MSFYINADKISLDDLRKRIEKTDLVPSRTTLLNDIELNFEKLKKVSIITLQDLRNEMKTKKKITFLSRSSGVDHGYLTLLKREIEGYFPKPQKLLSFGILNKKSISKFETDNLKNSVLLYEAINTSKKRFNLAKSYEIDIHVIESMYCLINLTRIRWVSPLAARMLVSAGYDNPKKISNADFNDLYISLEKTNKENKYFKGTIGIRDIKRLIDAATYID